MINKNLKIFRRKIGLTQKELAEKLGCAQSMVAKMEKDGNVPYQYEEILSELFGFGEVDFLDAIHFGGAKAVEKWELVIKSMKHWAEDEGRTLNEVIDEGSGLIEIFQYFLEQDVEFPIPNISHQLLEDLAKEEEIELMEFDEVTIEKVQSNQEARLAEPPFEDKAWLGIYQLLNEVDLNLANFQRAVTSIFSKEELDGEDYLQILDRGVGFVWNQLLEEWDDPPLLEVLKSTPEFRAQYKKNFTQLVLNAWRSAWRGAQKPDAEINFPTWTVRDLLFAAEDDWSSLITTTIDQELIAGLSPDPFVRDLQKQVADLGEMVASLHEKVDLLTSNFGIQNPTSGHYKVLRKGDE